MDKSDEKTARKKKKWRIAILVLAILLLVSVLILLLLFLRGCASDRQTTVVLPDNGINPDGSGLAGALTLYRRQESDNVAFSVQNMFPGDEETKTFCVRVLYHDTVTLRFHADILKTAPLAEVLQVRVRLLDSKTENAADTTLYDGLLRDMPAALTLPLTPADASATYSDITYEITAYLDTSVGNAYQNGGLSVNFRWWVEETDHLGTPALGEKPGESSSGGSGGCRFCWLWILLAILILLAVLILVFVLIKRRKEKSNRENSENREGREGRA